mmetsp:Transcript_53089/g.153114  ORF Transcript_53089/g.153114 Transcript_53089/m.153114 type:complete len:282 (-) Transcript_53089:137-982(-)
MPPITCSSSLSMSLLVMEPPTPNLSSCFNSSMRPVNNASGSVVTRASASRRVESGENAHRRGVLGSLMLADNPSEPVPDGCAAMVVERRCRIVCCATGFFSPRVPGAAAPARRSPSGRRWAMASNEPRVARRAPPRADEGEGETKPARKALHCSGPSSASPSGRVGELDAMPPSREDVARKPSPPLADSDVRMAAAAAAIAAALEAESVAARRRPRNSPPSAVGFGRAGGDTTNEVDCCPWPWPLPGAPLAERGVTPGTGLLKSSRGEPMVGSGSRPSPPP